MVLSFVVVVVVAGAVGHESGGVVELQNKFLNRTTISNMKLSHELIFLYHH